MPVSKGGYKRKRKPRTSAWYKKKYSVGDIATKALKGVQYIKTLVNAETKIHDISQDAQTYNYNGLLTLLSGIPQGDSEVERSGISLFTKSVFIRGVVKANTVSENNLLRILIIRDTMNTGSTPSVSSILETTGSAIAPLSPLQNTSAGRYQVLFSKFFTFSNNGNTSQVFKAYIPLKKHIKYTGPLATDEWKNQIYFLGISDVITNDPELSFVSRLSFYDN